MKKVLLPLAVIVAFFGLWEVLAQTDQAEALVVALESGRLCGAALDVLEGQSHDSQA